MSNLPLMAELFGDLLLRIDKDHLRMARMIDAGDVLRMLDYEEGRWPLVERRMKHLSHFPKAQTRHNLWVLWLRSTLMQLREQGGTWGDLPVDMRYVASWRRLLQR